MATFEHWLLWVLKTLILSNPREFYPQSKKQIEVAYLKRFADMPMLWEELVNDYLSTLPYQGMETMLKTFLSCFGLKESDFTKKLLGMINENSQCRNVIMHNQKKVNDTYIKKCGKFGKFAKGERIVVTEVLLFDQADNLLRFMQDFRRNHAPDVKTV
jgi:molybdopterin-biosynthesis enzyme MoeA-like protein